ncbi:MAG: MlaD family protein [Treponema sp.]|nr:MlaD family protein [Treponema sp.]MCL2250322.1 MlaD family protein [Treponema sp.]
MKFSIRYSDQIVGLLVIMALVIIIFAVFMLGRTQRWFTKDYQYKTYFTSAQGLSQNMAIQFKGFTIGNVKKIELAADDRVEVIFVIFEEYAQRVKEGSLVEVQVSPIGLGNAFIFHPGLGNELIPEGMIIPEINSAEARLLRAQGLVSRPDTSGDSINAIVNQVNTFLDTINKSLAASGEDGKPPLGLILDNINNVIADVLKLTGSLSSMMAPLLANVESVSAQIADPTSTVSKILDGDGALYSSLEDSLVSLSQIIESLNKTVEFVPAQLPQIGVLIGQINVMISKVHEILTSVANNPLLKGGIPERVETGPGGASPRNEKFIN